MARKKKNENEMTLLQTFGITRVVVRPREECDIMLREDRIGRYFKKYLKRFVFVEFSEEFMNKSKGGDLMRGVPIPLRKKEVKEFAGGAGIDMLVIAENMAWIMGCDPHFKYNKNYADILLKIYNGKIYEGMLRKGRDAAERGDYDYACIMFRATLCMRYDYLHGMYSYARVCRAMYLASHNEEYVGRFKAEAFDWFELLTETHPRFANGFYYAGYAYLNAGLYRKAELAWRNFVRFSRNRKDRNEIYKRLEQIAEPVQIEHGFNFVTTGKYEDGLKILEPFMKTKFNDFWPLHMYIGIAYKEMGKFSDAVARFKYALQLNGSNLAVMKELLEIYEAEDDRANIKKYREKIAMIEANMEEDQKAAIKEIEEENKRLENDETEFKGEPEHIDLSDADELEASEADGTSAKADKSEKKSMVKRLFK